MDDLPFPLVRSLPFSRCAKERDSWELRQICGHSLTCEQNKIVCVSAFVWFSLTVLTFSAELTHKWDVIRANVYWELTKHCQNTAKEGNWAVG